MNKRTYLATVCLGFIFVFLLYSSTSSAKKRCKPFLEKLHKVQASQRKGYSLKRGESLRGKEDKARDIWWECENSSLAKFNKKYGSKKKSKKKAKKKTTKIAKSSYKKSTKSNSYYNKLNKVSYAPYKTKAIFNKDSAIVIKSKFQGDKHLAWLAYYDKPEKCQRPKTMSVFAFCNEHKRQQQEEFDQSYQE